MNKSLEFIISSIEVNYDVEVNYKRDANKFIFFYKAEDDRKVIVHQYKDSFKLKTLDGQTVWTRGQFQVMEEIKDLYYCHLRELV